MNNEKSRLLPMNTADYLGFFMSVELPEEKKEKMKNMLYLKLNQKMKIRDLVKILGSLVPCCPAVSHA